MLTQALELYNQSPLALSFENIKKDKSKDDLSIGNLSDFFSESSFRFNDNNYGQRQRKNQKLVLGDRNFLTLEAKLTEEQKAKVVNLVKLRRELLASLS